MKFKEGMAFCPAIIFIVFVQLSGMFMRIPLILVISVSIVLLLMHTQAQTLTESHTFYSYLLPSRQQNSRYLLFYPLSLLSFPSHPIAFLCFPLLSAFPWLAVINLPSLGAESWLRARKRSYKAKTAIQKQSRFSCFQSTTKLTLMLPRPSGQHFSTQQL